MRRKEKQTELSVYLKECRRLRNEERRRVYTLAAWSFKKRGKRVVIEGVDSDGYLATTDQWLKYDDFKIQTNGSVWLLGECVMSEKALENCLRYEPDTLHVLKDFLPDDF